MKTDKNRHNKAITARACLLGALITQPSDAAAASNVEDKRWRDEAELSFIDTGGNSEVKTLSGKNLLEYRASPQVALTWKVELLRGSDRGITNSDRSVSTLRARYTFDEKRYAFAVTGILQDRFAGIDKQWHVGGGVGYGFLSGPVHMLAGEAGIQQVSASYTDESRDTYFGSRFFGEYAYKFNDKDRFVQSLEYAQDLKFGVNRQLNSEAALVFDLTDRFATKISYTIRHNNNPIPDTPSKTDTVLAVALVATL
jgi:putative salt-induced outer membrane protein YdiY